MNKLIEWVDLARFWVAWFIMPTFARKAMVRLAEQYEAFLESHQ